MATNRIKGITIEIDGNTSPLSKSLKDVDKSLKDTQNQLNDVNKLLKLDPSNVELLRQKQDLLQKAIGDTKTRQEELKKALEQAQNAGDTEENRKQQDLLQRELIETEQKLKGYEDQLKEATGDTEEAGEAMEKATGSASTFGDTLKAKLTGEAIIAGVKKLGSALKSLALDAVELSDELATQAQVTGLSTDTLQEYAYMAELVDVSVDTITGSMTKLTKSMSSASKGSGDAYEAFKRLGVSTTNLDGSLRDNEAVFNDLIDALGSVTNETERDALAMTLFGKSAKELNPIINAGSKQLKAYAKEAHDVGYVMDKDMIQRNVEASDAIQRFKKSAEGVKNALGSAFAPTITKVAEGMQKLVKWSRENAETLKTIGKAVATAAAAFVTYKAVVAALELKTKLATAAQALLNGTMAVNPAAIVATALAAVVSALVLFSKKTVETSAEIKQFQAEMDEFTNSVNENADAWDNVVEAQGRQAENAEAEFSYYASLADELAGIVDANGKVKEGYEGRAEVITGILAESLGVEIEMTNGVIKNYDTLQAEIDELIVKKKAELILQSQEEAYKQAIQARQKAALDLIETEKKRSVAAQKYSKEQDELTKMELERQRLEKEGLNDYNIVYYNNLLKQIEQKKTNVEALKAESEKADDAYAKSKRVVEDASYNIQLYEQNLAAVTRGEYDKIITANADVARSYNDLDTEGKAAMDELTGDTAKLGADLYAETKQAGEDFINGFIKGIENRKPALKKTVSGTGTSGKQWLKDSLNENSPSKATEEMGEFFVEGLEIGIKNAARNLFTEVTRFGQNTLAAFQAATSAGFGMMQAPGLAGPSYANAGAAAMINSGANITTGGVNVSVVVNGNVDNYDELAEVIGQKLQQQMAREERAFA